MVRRITGFESTPQGLGFNSPLGEYPDLSGGPWQCVAALVPPEVWVAQSSLNSEGPGRRAVPLS